MASIYIHIPFCERKCQYCDFISFTHKESCLSKYIDCLIAEIISYDVIQVDTVYIGGGTPSLVADNDIKRLLLAVRQHHSVKPDAEISIECNPNSISENKLRLYRELGINRLSLGIQSMNDKILHIIGRLHNSEQALKGLRLASKYFENINVDLMIGLPVQTVNDVICAIDKISPFVSHISVYSLILEEGTPLYVKVQQGEVVLASEEDTVLMYDEAYKKLEESGFKRYEVSNFSKDRPCLHNIAYWTNKDYYGFGVASHSFVKGIRASNTESLDDYLSGVTKVDSYSVTKQQTKQEYFMLRLRMAQGIDFDDYTKTFGESLMIKNEIIERLVSNGLVIIKDNCLQATDLGFHLLNYIILQLLD